jgi:group I intron endonuclease
MERVVISTTCGIYKITCRVTALSYIGKAINMKKRWAEHQRGRFSSKHFEYSVLEECAPEDCSERERAFIAEYKTREPFGFNKNSGNGPGRGHLGRKQSQETKDKISAGNKGKTLSPEHCEKLSVANRGRDMTACTAAAAAANRGRKVPYRPANPDHVLKRLATRAANFANKNKEI